MVYTKSGSRLAAARIEDTGVLIQEKLYWATAHSVDEACYLTAVLNSATLAEQVAPYQSRGQFGARDFDLYVWYVAVPEYDSGRAPHVELAELGARAETVAASVELDGGIGFQVARRRVRQVSADHRTRRGHPPVHAVAAHAV